MRVVRLVAALQSARWLDRAKWALVLARPAHWIKNVFVLAPVPFAVAAGAQLRLVPFVTALLGFCLVNSAIYVFNDLRDAAGDRLHPRKKDRPIAAGHVPPLAAALESALLLVLGIGLCLAGGGPAALPLVFVYVAVNAGYSLGAKHVALLDVFLLTSGFVIRVLLGCVLLSAVPSAWLLLCSSSLALFLGFAKRKCDLEAGIDVDHRPALQGYSQTFLRQAMNITAAVAFVSYAIYSIESPVFLEGRELAAMPFVAYGILNYLRLATVENGTGSPVEVAYTSPSSILCAAGWLVAVTWSLGWW